MTVYCHTTYLASMPSILCEMLGWMKHKLKSRLLGGISITSDAVDTTFMAESEEEIKSPLMKVKEESEIAGLKLNIQKTKIMASSPITLWQIGGETMETARETNKQKTVIFWAPISLQMVTAAMKLKDVCSLKAKL